VSKGYLLTLKLNFQLVTFNIFIWKVTLILYIEIKCVISDSIDYRISVKP